MCFNPMFIKILRRKKKNLFGHLPKMLGNQLIILKTGDEAEIQLFILTPLYKLHLRTTNHIDEKFILYKDFRYK